MALTSIAAGAQIVTIYGRTFEQMYVFCRWVGLEGGPEGEQASAGIILARQFGPGNNWAWLPVYDWPGVDDKTNSFALGPRTPYSDGLPTFFTLVQGSVQELPPRVETVPYWRPGNQNMLYGTGLIQIVVGSNADGRLEVFAIGGDRGLYHIWQLSVPQGYMGPSLSIPYSAWHSLSGTDLQQITVASNADGRLEVFALGGDRGLWHIWQLSPNGDWGGWQSLGGTDLQQITVASNTDGRLEVFALGGDRGLWHIWQLSPNGDWGGWQTLTPSGGDVQQIVVGSNADGRLEVFALTEDEWIDHIWQLSPNGDWGGWQTLGGSNLQQIAVASKADGRLDVFAVDANQGLSHISQQVPNGGWGEWQGLTGAPPP